FATDLGVETSLDVCDALGLSGLTISSDTNCLVITGEVNFEFDWGDFSTAPDPDARNEITNNTVEFDQGVGPNDWNTTVTGFLQFKATADSDFGPAVAVVNLGFNAANLNNNNLESVFLNELWVGIGDTTMIMAGLKGSIFNTDDDEPLNWLGLFNSQMVDAGVGFDTGPDTGGIVLQVVHDMGNGLSIGGALEDLNNNGTAVGVLAYASDTVSAHASFAVNDILSGGFSDWFLHAGFTGTFDTVKVVGAIAAEEDYWNILGSASITFDTITLAVSGEADDTPVDDMQFGLGGSITAAIDDGVSVSGGVRFWQEEDGDQTLQAAVGVTADVSEGLSATAEAGWVGDDLGAELFYGKGELTWAPGGGFTATASAEANTLGAFKLGTTMSKTIE
ncbi:MAG: hypothetical protein ABL879_12935, partial [Devosia sp.]